MKKKYLNSVQKAENETRAHKKGLVPKSNVIINKKVTRHTNKNGHTLVLAY